MSKTKEYDAASGKIIDPERRKAVMLLADEADGDVLTNVLRDKRFRILGMTGKLDAAMELMRKHKVGIIFLDTDIAGLNLEDTLLQIKRRYSDFMVILLSASVTKEKIEFGFANGAMAYLAKPLTDAAVSKSMSRFSLN